MSELSTIRNDLKVSGFETFLFVFLNDESSEAWKRASSDFIYSES